MYKLELSHHGRIVQRSVKNIQFARDLDSKYGSAELGLHVLRKSKLQSEDGIVSQQLQSKMPL